MKLTNSDCLMLRHLLVPKSGHLSFLHLLCGTIDRTLGSFIGFYFVSELCVGAILGQVSLEKRRT